MAAKTMLDFSDIKEAVRENLGIQSTDTTNMNKLERYINTIYTQYVVPYKRWTWLHGDTRIKHSAPYENGTVSVTPESTTVTLSVAPGASDGTSGSFENYLFSVDGFDEIYRITSHTALSTTITLDTEFLGALNATAGFKIWRDRIDLPTDAYETIDVWHDRYAKKMEGVGRQELVRIEGQNGRKAEAFPRYYSTQSYYDPTPLTAETESDRYRQVRIYPSLTTEDVTINVMYSKEVTDLELAADEPIIPREYRFVLVLGALWQGYQHIIRDTQEALYYRQEFEAYLARMAGKTSDSNDTPTIRPKLNYLSKRRQGRIGGYKYEAGNYGGSSSASPPTYAKDITLEGGTITANFTVSSGITIDGRDISADGTTLDSLSASFANIDTANRVVITDASTNLEESDITSTEILFLDDVADLQTVALADNSSDQTIFSTSASSFDVYLVHYSIKRGSANIEIGTAYIATDGTNATTSEVGANLGTLGVTFNATISGGNVLWRATTTSTGTAATLKYKLHKWQA